jgi:hypothetical protein
MTEYISLVQQDRMAQTAERLYSRTRRTGQFAAIWGRLVGRPAGLLDLTALAGRVQGQHAEGVQTVPLAQIQGSEGRTTDFDAAFHPVTDHTQSRWASVACAQLANVPLPAVELIRVGAVYYVRDGHHRISVACALGQCAIDARVTVWDVAPAPLAASQAPHVADFDLATGRGVAPPLLTPPRVVVRSNAVRILLRHWMAVGTVRLTGQLKG